MRAAQMEALEDARARAAVPELVRWLRERFPDDVAAISPDALARRVEGAVALARCHDLASWEAVTAFVSLVLLVGPRFTELPPVRALLRDASVPPDERMARVLERITDRQWRSAERRRTRGGEG
ncbi:hypothetical protein WME94_27000 [Sorangium sp. So ce429]